MSQIPPLPRLPNVLLGLLSVICFGGPLPVWLVLGGGTSGEWPPDRPIEWLVVGVVIAAAAALFVACITVGRWYPWPGRGPGRGRAGVER